MFNLTHIYAISWGNWWNSMLSFISQVSPLIQLLSTLAILAYVVLTWRIARGTMKSATVSEKMLSEMESSRVQQTSADIVVYFDIDPVRWVINFIVRNIGRSIARQVKLEIDPPLRSSIKRDFTSASWATKGIGSLHPDGQFSTMLDFVREYFHNDELPRRYFVKASYINGANGERVESTYDLDLGPYENVLALKETGMTDLVRQLRDITGHLRSLSQSMQSLAKKVK